MLPRGVGATGGRDGVAEGYWWRNELLYSSAFKLRFIQVSTIFYFFVIDDKRRLVLKRIPTMTHTTVFSTADLSPPQRSDTTAFPALVCFSQGW